MKIKNWSPRKTTQFASVLMAVLSCSFSVCKKLNINNFCSGIRCQCIEYLVYITLAPASDGLHTPVHSAAKQMCQFLLPRQKIGATWVLDKHFFLLCKCETTTSNANAFKTMGWIYFMGNILIFSCLFFHQSSNILVQLHYSLDHLVSFRHSRARQHNQ